MRIGFIFCTLFFITGAFAEERASTTAIKMPHEESAASDSSVSVKGAALLTYGTTSNATLLSQPTPGSFTKVSPSLSVDYSPSDSLVLAGTFDGSMRYFTDPTVRPLANEQNLDLKTDVISFLGESWEIGANLSYFFLENHMPVLGTSSVEALPQKYYQPEARLYGVYDSGKWTFEMGGATAPRRYETTTTDIQGNIYKNSYDEYKIDGKASYRLSRSTKLSFRSTLEQRNYLERMAEFSDGLPISSGNSNPLLSTFAQDNELQLKTRVATTDLNSALSVRFEKDQVYGARDSTRIRFKQKASIPIFSKASLEPEASISRQNYPQFRSDPVNDPRSSELRMDWESHLGSTVKVELSKSASAQIQYAFNRKNSNYAPENYLEHVVETGMNIQF